jgi:hypothetical protein
MDRHQSGAVQVFQLLAIVAVDVKNPDSTLLNDIS